jgi:hypothetical protein
MESPKIKKHRYIGYYNELEYKIFDFDKMELVYSAGNHPYDSQGYISAEKGVGLDKMREYCEHTGKEQSRENGAEWLGAEYEEPEEQEE